ncbi:HIT-like domain-containing protein [Mucor mucedo]|uniref:HIT-like domain-containing protein n=1 Tax=Mucor mucedo TaxID=29922 RepID=UPI00221F7374|nr:HIT-like domain-containing protein [Mucor mucedo]KAI7891442.1 HIT-like domain-containing protein [Mucor mucedo]
MACCSVGKKKECIFCHIGDSVGARIVIETEHLVAFRDRSPSSQVHLLVIPKQHVRTVKDLDEGHVALVQEMVDLGKRLLKEQGYNPEDTTQTR